jgi:hypothetical protein
MKLCMLDLRTRSFPELAYNLRDSCGFHLCGFIPHLYL